jgi:hypothetical protein
VREGWLLSLRRGTKRERKDDAIVCETVPFVSNFSFLLCILTESLAKSKQNEKTLIHALKDPNSFEVAPIVPMLPNDPVVLEQDMAVAKNFHMSQVDGAQKQTSKKRKLCATARPWELSETEEFQRSCILGKLSNNPPIFEFEHLRRRFLNARMISSSYSSKRKVLRGRVSSLIKTMESLHPLRFKPIPANNFTVKARGSSMEALFPMTNATYSKTIQQAKNTNFNLVEKSDRRSLCLETFPMDVSSTKTSNASISSMGKKSIYQPQPLQASKSKDDVLFVELTDMTSGNCAHEPVTTGNSPTSKDEIHKSSTLQTPSTATLLMPAAKTKSMSTSGMQTVPILRSSDSRVRFSLDSCNLKDISMSCESQHLFAPQNRKKSCRLAIDDTPESVGTKLPSMDHVRYNTETELQDTQEVCSIDHFVCAICMTNCVSDENPIILCDGPGHGIECDLVVHQNCYSAKCIMTEDNEWRCDRCQHSFDGGLDETIMCFRCNLMDGILKKSLKGQWEHVSCSDKNTLIRSKCILRPLHQPCESRHTKQRATPFCGDKAVSPGALLLEKKRRRKLVMQKFIDYEAEASDVDESEDLEELQIQAIEEEEDKLAGNFINDTSQLGYSPDNLDRLTFEQSPINTDGTATTHRVLDMEREKALQFATPVLNRRMMQNRDIDEGSDESIGPPEMSAAPDSTRGLGNMNFVRSVLEHHRQGGSVDEIESFYQELVAEQKNAFHETVAAKVNK